MAFWDRWFKSTKKVTVEFAAEELRVLKWFARERQIPLVEYMRASVLSSIPVEDRMRYEGTRKREAGVETMFDRLDAEIAQIEENEPLPEYVAPDDLPLVPLETHPCRFASEAPETTVYTQAQGLCWHPDQRGHPCHWAESFYTTCPLSVGKKRRA